MSEYKELPIPRVVIGVLLLGDDGRGLLFRSKKWSDQWCIAGGHLEWGESLIDAARREAKEETGLEIEDVEFLGYQEAIHPKEFHEKRHFLFMDFVAKAKPGKIQLNEELQEHKWVELAEALKLHLNPYTRVTVERFIKQW